MNRTRNSGPWSLLWTVLLLPSLAAAGWFGGGRKTAAPGETLQAGSPDTPRVVVERSRKEKESAPEDPWLDSLDYQVRQVGEWRFWVKTLPEAELSRDQRERDEDRLKDVLRSLRSAQEAKQEAEIEFNQIMRELPRRDDKCITSECMRKEILAKSDLRRGISKNEFQSMIEEILPADNNPQFRDQMNLRINDAVHYLFESYPLAADSARRVSSEVQSRNPRNVAAAYVDCQVFFELNQIERALASFERLRAGGGLPELVRASYAEPGEVNRLFLKMADAYSSHREFLPYLREQKTQPSFDLDRVKEAYLLSLMRDLVSLLLREDPDFDCSQVLNDWVQLFVQNKDRAGAEAALLQGRELIEAAKRDPELQLPGSADDIYEFCSLTRLQESIDLSSYDTDTLRLRRNLSRKIWGEGKVQVKFFLKHKDEEVAQFRDFRIVTDRFGSTYVTFQSSYNSDWVDIGVEEDESIYGKEEKIKLAEGGEQSYTIEMTFDRVKIPGTRFPFVIQTGGRGENLEPTITCDLQLTYADGGVEHIKGKGFRISNTGEVCLQGSKDDEAWERNNCDSSGRVLKDIRAGYVSGTIIMDYNQINGKEKHVTLRSTLEAAGVAQRARHMALGIVGLLGIMATVAP